MSVRFVHGVLIGTYWLVLATTPWLIDGFSAMASVVSQSKMVRIFLLDKLVASSSFCGEMSPDTASAMFSLNRIVSLSHTPNLLSNITNDLMFDTMTSLTLHAIDHSLNLFSSLSITCFRT